VARGRDRQSYYYSTSSSDGGGEEGEGEESEESGEEEEAVKHLHQQLALAPISVPDIFPEVPVLPVSRNPIFPKFVKMLEVRVHHTQFP
jgi:Lon-like ATP-dependent protease